MVRRDEGVEYGMRKEQNVSVKTMEQKRKGKSEERRIETARGKLMEMRD